MAQFVTCPTIEPPYVYSSSHMIPRWKLTPAVFPPGSPGAQIRYPPTMYRLPNRAKAQVPVGSQPRQNDGCYDHLQDLLVHSLVLGEAHLWNPYTPCRHELEVGQTNNELFLLIVCIHRHRLPGGVVCSLCALSAPVAVFTS